MLRAVTLDVHGTLLAPRQPVARSYAALGRRHGVTCTEGEIAARFGASMLEARAFGPMTGDGRSFWRIVVERSTGSANPAYFEELYHWFALPDAWRVEDGAIACCRRLRAAGVGLGIVSNADARLRPLLAALGLLEVMDVVVISGEVGVEKPDPAIFRMALDHLGVTPAEALHAGDSGRDDVAGAQSAGMRAWRWPQDVGGFAALAERVLHRA